MVFPVLGLPEIAEGDQLGYVRANQVIEIILRFACVPAVISSALTAPPGSVIRSQMWILGGAGTGQWTGRAAGDIAYALSDNPTSASGWFFFTPTYGFRVWIIGTGHRVHDGSGFVAV